jgi:5-methylcytosine-specific restriction endonuclease McrA
MLISEQPRDCERYCVECREWKHFSRFRSWKDSRNSTVSEVWFSPRCRDCEQKKRNEKKNTDRPRTIIEQRARSAAQKTGTGFEFFWINLNYRALVPPMRAMMTSEGLCQGCGHPFVNERDIQIDHIEPPRHQSDWARLHARNVRLACGSCNRTKGKKIYSEWLDEQEGARLSNQKMRGFDEVDNQPPSNEIQIEAFHLGVLGQRPTK